MANQITDGPNKYDFGLSFNYALWHPESVITMLNVPWDNTYRDVVRFDNRAALNKYIDDMPSARTRVITGMSYVKANRPIRIEDPFNSAYRYNYIRVSNPVQPTQTGAPDVQKDYYYFITGVNYVAPNTTEITVQLDVFQTFIYDVSFGQCYLERGHIGIANVDAFSHYGREWLTAPEGFDLGTDYVVGATVRDSINFHSNDHDILVASSVELDSSFFDGEGAPVLHSSEGGYVGRLPAGAAYYVARGEDGIRTLFTALSDAPHISQAILSIQLIPKITRFDPQFTYDPDGVYGLTRLGRNEPNFIPRLNNMANNFRELMRTLIPERYRHLTKFLTSPYMVIQFGLNNGSAMILKPELIGSSSFSLYEHMHIMPPNARVAFYPLGYNSIEESPTGADGERWDAAVYLGNFPQVSVVNDMAAAYLMSNFHSLQYQNESADWSHQKALRGNELSYDQASAGIELAATQNAISQQLDADQTALGNRTQIQSALFGGLAGTAAGLAGGPISGAMAGAQAVANGVQTGMQVSANNESLAMRQAANRQSQAASTSNAEYMRDTNRGLADWAANGDYENAIAGLNAKTRDARLIQPGVSGQQGGESMMFDFNENQITVKFKCIDDASFKRIGDFWLRYGYAMNVWTQRVPGDLHCMDKFTYWKMRETYLIAANMPELFKQTIRGIFEKGVTVWRNPADIGNVDIAENSPLPGIRV